MKLVFDVTEIRKIAWKKYTTQIDDLEKRLRQQRILVRECHTDRMRLK